MGLAEPPGRYGSLRFVSPQEWRPLGIDDLEPAAWEALRHHGNSAVTAGPGAGKSEFLAQRAAYLLQTGLCPPRQRILAISYKRSSATNLAERLTQRLPEHAGRLHSMTFDSFTKGLVDRFRAVLPPAWALRGAYQLDFWKERPVQDYLGFLASRSGPEHQSGLYGLQASSFLYTTMGSWPLPADPSIPPLSTSEFAAWSWWQEHYLLPPVQTVDFTMLNRLAELLVRTTPQLLRALRLTYPYVFVDEFQDTTAAQFGLLSSVFKDHAKITVVGDGKQQIMRFAGALPNATGKFVAEFDARPYPLVWNFRSSAELVQLQHVIAARLDPDVGPAISRAAREEGHIPLRLWRFSGVRTEAARVAAWIAEDTAASSRRPADFALIAKQKVADLAGPLTDALARHGIALRNDDADYGTSRLQDLIKNDVTRLIIGVLRLAADPVGLGDLWLETRSLLAQIRADVHDDITDRALSDELAAFTSQLRAWMRGTSPAQADPDDVVARSAAIVPADALHGFVSSRHRGEDADLLLQSIALRLADVQAHAASWSDAAAGIAAEDAVTLTTIHRSKGLEFHTVIFLGLDDDQWWAYNKDIGEATSAFFVGSSRAAQRLIFTTTSPRARIGKISDFYALLAAAGAQEEDWD